MSIEAKIRAMKQSKLTKNEPVSNHIEVCCNEPQWEQVEGRREDAGVVATSVTNKRTT